MTSSSEEAFSPVLKPSGEGAEGFDFEREVGRTRRAALQVLLNNVRTGRAGLPRTAAWGRPEPHTRDLMIGSLGVLASGNEELAQSLRQTLITLAQHQSHLGAMPRICDEPSDLSASDATPLFLIGLAAYRQIARAPGFLDETAQMALRWCDSQNLGYGGLIAGKPMNELGGEPEVFGYGLFVNTLLHTALVLFGRGARAALLREEMNHPVGHKGSRDHAQEGLVVPSGPYYALCSYKIEHSERFDLLGNSVAILSGVASRHRAVDIIHWLELTCDEMRSRGQLQTRCPPNIIPPIFDAHGDYKETSAHFYRPGESYNGGTWPFICGFYVAALVAAGQQTLAEQQLVALTELCACKKNEQLEFGFNEWIRSSDGWACGEDWQFWSASMYLYAARCVELGRTPLFEAVRSQTQGWVNSGIYPT